MSTRHPDGTAALEKALDVLDTIGQSSDIQIVSA